LLSGKVVAAHVGRDHVHVVLERPRAVGDLEHVVLGERRGQEGAIDHFRAVQREAAAILRKVSLHRHHDAEPTDRGIDDRPEGLQRAAVFLDPPVEQVVRRDRALAGQQGGDLVVLEDDLARRIDDEADVEEAVGPVLVARLGLGHDEHVRGARQLAQAIGLGTGNVDGAGPGELGMVDRGSRR
jgi:hypothetical protein